MSLMDRLMKALKRVKVDSSVRMAAIAEVTLIVVMFFFNATFALFRFFVSISLLLILILGGTSSANAF